MLGTFAITIDGKEFTWRRSYDAMHKIELTTSKTLVQLAVARMLSVKELFTVLRAVLSADQATDNFIRKYIANNYQKAISDVADILIKIMTDPEQQKSKDEVVDGDDVNEVVG